MGVQAWMAGSVPARQSLGASSTLGKSAPFPSAHSNPKYPFLLRLSNTIYKVSVSPCENNKGFLCWETIKYPGYPGSQFTFPGRLTSLLLRLMRACTRTLTVLFPHTSKILHPRPRRHRLLHTQPPLFKYNCVMALSSQM